MPAIRAFIAKYQHQLSIGSFFVGFAIDSLALKRIDLLVSNLLLYTYFTVVVVSIALLHYRSNHKTDSEWRKRVLVWLPFVTQFGFGGMFSGFLIFYSQSGSVFTSWPFLSLIIVLIAINEFLREYQNRLTFQSLLLFFCLFSFSIYSVPIFIGRIGDTIFEASGLIALVLFIVYLLFLAAIDYRRVKDSLYNICIGAIIIYGLITALYFSNVLPPIPLALKDIGVYQNVARVGDTYQARGQDFPWYVGIEGRTVVVPKGSVLYAYSSVFAPTHLETQIAHQWQYHNPVSGSWETKSTIPFTIGGGRDGGYRGYTAKELSPGEWRVNVITLRGQLIGRITFTVVDGVLPTMVERTLE